MEENIKNVEIKLNFTNNSNKELTNNLKKITEENEILKKKNQTLIYDNDSIKEQLNGNNIYIEQMLEKNNKKNETIKQNEEEILNIRSELNANKTKNEELNKYVKQIADENKKINYERKLISEERERLLKTFDNKIKEKEEEIQKQNKQLLFELKNNNDILNGQLKIGEENNKKIKQLLYNSQKEYTSKTEEYLNKATTAEKTLLEKTNNYDKEIKELNKKNKQLEYDINKKNEDNEKLNKKNQQLENDINEKNEDNEKLIQENNKLNNDYKNLIRTNYELVNENDKNNRELANKNKENEQLRNNIQNIKIENKVLKDNEKNFQKVREEYQDDINELNKKINTLLIQSSALSVMNAAQQKIIDSNMDEKKAEHNNEEKIKEHKAIVEESKQILDIIQKKEKVIDNKIQNNKSKNKINNNSSKINILPNIYQNNPYKTSTNYYNIDVKKTTKDININIKTAEDVYNNQILSLRQKLYILKSLKKEQLNKDKTKNIIKDANLIIDIIKEIERYYQYNGLNLKKLSIFHKQEIEKIIKKYYNGKKYFTKNDTDTIEEFNIIKITYNDKPLLNDKQLNYYDIYRNIYKKQQEIINNENDNKIIDKKNDTLTKYINDIEEKIKQQEIIKIEMEKKKNANIKNKAQQKTQQNILNESNKNNEDKENENKENEDKENENKKTKEDLINRQYNKKIKNKNNLINYNKTIKNFNKNPYLKYKNKPNYNVKYI